MRRFSRGVRRLAVVLAALAPVAALAEFDEDYDARQWQEVAVQLPPAPEGKNLLPFYVSATTDNRFFVDGASLAVGGDGVVRYVLVVEAGGGARNVTYEGLRCETKELRVYAFGQRDGSWSKARNNDWRRIRDAIANRQHVALFSEYLCPPGMGLISADAMREALRRGGHPQNQGNNR